MFLLSESLKVVKGQSLAEFAVITAMMATFITTALPTFSDLMETGKGNKSIQELRLVDMHANYFYLVFVWRSVLLVLVLLLFCD